MAKRIAKEDKWKKKSRFYEVEGEHLPSVTTILGCIGKPALVAWAAKVERVMVMEEAANLYQENTSSGALYEGPMSRMAFLTMLTDRLGKTKASQKELAKASEIGTLAHGAIEWRIKQQLLHDIGPYPEIPPAAQLAVNAWERWKESVNFKPLMCEQAVWSKTHKFAGTMDLLAEINGETTLLDWKTGKSVYRESFLQNIAYRFALCEMNLIPDWKTCKGLIVRLPKLETDPEFEAVPVTEDPEELITTFWHVQQLWRWLQVEELTEVVEPTKPEDLEKVLAESVSR